MDRNSLVSVIVPMYNSEDYIYETLNSVNNQTYLHWECIIIDDGSTDSSAQIVSKFCACDNRFRYFQKENEGPSSARNLGLRLSRGEFVQFLDSDDIMHTNRLEVIISQYMHVENNIILYSDLVVVDNDDSKKTAKFSSKITIGKDLDFKLMYRHFGNDVLFTPGCVLFPMSAIKNIAWDDTISHSEDWDYYLKITGKNHFNFRHYPQVLYSYRNSINSLSKDLLKTYQSNFRILERYRQNSNIIDYCRKSGTFFCRNLINFKEKRVDKILWPFSLNSKKSIISVLLFPLSLYFSVYYLISLKIR